MTLLDVVQTPNGTTTDTNTTNVLTLSGEHRGNGGVADLPNERKPLLSSVTASGQTPVPVPRSDNPEDFLDDCRGIELFHNQVRKDSKIVKQVGTFEDVSAVERLLLFVKIISL